MGRLTARSLRLEPEEAAAFRAAKVPLDELALLDADEVVKATGEQIDAARAAELVGVASLLTTGVIGSDIAYDLVAFGVRDRDDLGTRSPEEIFVQVLDRTPHDSPIVYDFFCLAIDVAGHGGGPRTIKGWSEHRAAKGFDPMLHYWRSCYGSDVALPVATSLRLRIPSQRVSAKVVECPDALPPLGAREVSRVTGGGLAFIGHESWAGRKGALAGLASLSVGDELVLVGERHPRPATVVGTRAGDAPLGIDVPDGALVVRTRPRLMWDTSAPQQVVVVATFGT